MTKEELKNYVDSTKEKIEQLEKKAFEENKSKYTIIKLQTEIHRNNVEVVESNLYHDLDENTLETFKIILDDTNRTLDMDTESFIKESSEERPVLIESVASKHTDEYDKELYEEEPTEEVVETVEEAAPVAEETTSDLDQVNTEEILNTLDDAPSVDPVPQDLVNEMLAAANEPTVEEPAAEVTEQPQQEVQAVPTQDINIDEIDALLNGLSEPSVEAGTVVDGSAGTTSAVAGAPEEQPVAAPEVAAPAYEEPVAVEAPVAPTMDAFAQQPIVTEAPVVEGPTLTL